MAKKKQNTKFKIGGTALLIKNAVFVSFLALLGLVYIFNAHNSEKKIRKINALKIDARDAHDKYMKIKKDVMLESTASELEKALKASGLKAHGKVPTIIGEG